MNRDLVAQVLNCETIRNLTRHLKLGKVAVWVAITATGIMAWSLILDVFGKCQ